jgi:acyl-CoA thioester hydrolase
MTADTPAPVDCWTESLAVYFDDFDLNGHLHNARLVALVERAQTSLFERLCGVWTRAADRHEDLHYVVRAMHLDFLAAVSMPGMLDVALQAQRIGTTSAVYGFRCRLRGAPTDAATGYRAIVKVDAAGGPTPWTAWYRSAFATLATGAIPQGPA